MRNGLLITLFLLCGNYLFGQDTYYWVGGSGNWSDISHWVTSSGGTVNYNVIPSPKDNVIFDANSFTKDGEEIILNGSRATFKNMDWSGINKQVSLSGSAELESYGTIIFSGKLTNEWTGDISFLSTPGDYSFKTANLSFNGNVNFNGEDASWVLVDSLILSDGGRMVLERGSLTSNGEVLLLGSIQATSSSEVTLDLSGSRVEFYGDTDALSINTVGIDWKASESEFLFKNQYPFADLVIIEGDAEIELPDINFESQEGHVIIRNTNEKKVQFGSVTFNGNGGIYGNNEFEKLVLGAGKAYEFEYDKTQLIYEEFIANGSCSQLTFLRSSRSGEHAIIQKTSGEVSLQFVDIKDIKGEGGAIFKATSSTDEGNNEGWDIEQSLGADFFWIGNSGSWNNPEHWSLSSGGEPAGCVPSQNDNVFFDENSFSQPNQSVQLTSTAYCRSMDWSGALHEPRLYGFYSMNLFGSMKLIPEMDFDLSSNIYFRSRESGNTITTANLNLEVAFYFDGVDGEWSLTDSLKSSRGLSLRHGNFLSKNQYLSLYRIESDGGEAGRALDLGTSKINLTYGLNLRLGGLTAVLNSCSFVFSGANADIRIIDYSSNSSDLVINEVMFSPLADSEGYLYTNTSNSEVLYRKFSFLRDGEIVHSVSFDSLFLAPAKTYELDPSGKKTINKYLHAVGNCNGAIQLRSRTSNRQATLVSASATINTQRLVIKDIKAEGGADFSASESIDKGNNDGWSFSVPLVGKDLYWVGGAGDWHDKAHWSYSSGGQGGACIPTPVDNVFFDESSFAGENNLVSVSQVATCKSMDWTGTIGLQSLEGTKSLEVYGSLILTQGLKFSLASRLYFKSDDAGNTIKTSGSVINSSVIFEGAGGWRLDDNFSLGISMSVSLQRGHLDLNEHILSSTYFYSESSKNRKLSTSNATFELGSLNIQINDSLFYDFGKTLFNFNYNSSWSEMSVYINTEREVLLGNVEFNELDFRKRGNLNIYDYGFEPQSINFSSLKFNTDGYLDFRNREVSVDSIILSSGKSYSFGASDTLTINKAFVANGDCSGRISLSSNRNNEPAFFSKINDTVQVQYVLLENIRAIGGAVFKADNSRDLGGLDGWLVNTEPGVDLFWVGGRGNWNDAFNWSFTSGGPGGACVPYIFDDVYFDENSFSAEGEQVSLSDNKGYCKNMDWSEADFKPAFSGSWPLEVYGSFILNGNMTYDHSSELIFASDSMSNQIDSKGVVVGSPTFFTGTGGWFLEDDLEVSNSVEFLSGSIDLRGKEFGTNFFKSDSGRVRVLKMENAQLSASNDFNSVEINTSGLLLSAKGSVIKINASMGPVFKLSGIDSLSFGSIIFNAGSGDANSIAELDTDDYLPIATFEDVSFNSNGIIQGDNEFRNLTFAPGQVYRIQAGTTQKIINEWIINGIGCFPIIIESSIDGEYYRVEKNEGTVDGRFLRISDSRVLGGAQFNATNSTDISNNEGWSFQDDTNVVEDILGSDIDVCEGEVYMLDASFGVADESFVWSDGSTESALQVTEPGKYWVSVTLGQSCQLSDTVNIDFKPVPTVDLGADQTVCEETELILNAAYSDESAAYLWSTGANNAAISPVVSGVYWVDVVLGTCTVRDSVNIQFDPLPIVDFGEEISLTCGEGPLSLDATLENATYVWQDASTESTLMVDKPGTYSVTITRNGCSYTEEVKVTFTDFPVADLGADQVLCEGDEITLSAGSPGMTYLWQDGSTSDELLVTTGGEYWVVVNNGVCEVSDTVTVSYLPRPEVDLGTDRVLCEGETLTLDVAFDNVDYTWSDGSGGSALTIDQAGEYWVRLSNEACFVTDTIVVSYVPVPLVDLGTDLVVCPNETVQLRTAEQDGINYLWSTNETSNEITIDQPGKYWLTADNGICAISDTLEIMLKPELNIDLGNDLTICEGDVLSLDVSSDDTDGNSYLWSTGDTGPQIDVSEPGSYSVIVRNSCYEAQDEINIEVGTAPEVNLGEDIELCFYDTLKVDVTIESEVATYLWNDGSTLPKREIAKPGIYSVEVTNGNCGMTSDELVVSRAYCGCRVFAPNAFTPNGDGYNDVFLPIPTCTPEDYKFSIYNRWGSLIFRSNQPEDFWDGTFNGERLQGTFLWRLEYTSTRSHGALEKVETGGMIQILR